MADQNACRLGWRASVEIYPICWTYMECDPQGYRVLNRDCIPRHPCVYTEHRTERGEQILPHALYLGDDGLTHRAKINTWGGLETKSVKPIALVRGPAQLDSGELP